MPGLHLIAQNVEDATVISALMQDAAVRADGMSFDVRRRRFLMLANRFCWEARRPARVRSVLTVGCVAHVARRGWPGGGAVLDLLAVRALDEATLQIDFGGGPGLRFTVECLDLMLDDVTAPWAAGRVPQHPG